MRVETLGHGAFFGMEQDDIFEKISSFVQWVYTSGLCIHSFEQANFLERNEDKNNWT